MIFLLSARTKVQTVVSPWWCPFSWAILTCHPSRQWGSYRIALLGLVFSWISDHVNLFQFCKNKKNRLLNEFSEWVSPESKLCHMLHWFFFFYCILFDIAFEENLLNWSLYCPRRNFLSNFLFKQVPSPPHPLNEAVSHGAKKKKKTNPQNSQSVLRDIFSIVLFLDTELPWYIINTEFLAVIKWQAPTCFDFKHRSFEFFEEICWTKNIWGFVFTLYFPDYFWPSLSFESWLLPPVT